MVISSTPSLADVARHAGVSLATASRALNDSYGVSPRTRKKVLASAVALDFVASPDASGLARGKTGRVAIVVPHIERWFFGQMVSGIERELAAADLDILLYHVGDAADRREFLAKLPARRKVDAVVVVAFPVDDTDRERLKLIGASIVAAGGQSASFPYVCIDDYAAGRLAMDHLTELGHRRIAMIGGFDPDQPGWPEVVGRSRAYDDSLAEAGAPREAALVREVPWGPMNAAEAMSQILDAPGEPPTAVYAHSDELALGALHTLRQRGLRVPEDISIVSIDDHPFAELNDLTTVSQDVRGQGETAAQLVFAELGRIPPLPSLAITAPVRLIRRASTRRI